MATFMNRVPGSAPQPDRYLMIWQQNVNKSLTGQGIMIEETSPLDMDVIAIQEPHIDHLGLSRAGSRWRAIYPSHNRVEWGETQFLLLISSLISSNAWYQLERCPETKSITRLSGYRPSQ